MLKNVFLTFNVNKLHTSNSLPCFCNLKGNIIITLLFGVGNNYTSCFNAVLFLSRLSCVYMYLDIITKKRSTDKHIVNGENSVEYSVFIQTN